MRIARTYRNLDTPNTLLGLTFPSEVIIQMTLTWVWMVSFDAGLAVLFMALSYTAIRATSFRRAPHFLEHAIGYGLRRVIYVGRVSAVARHQR